jgi:DNA-binding MarR family transcriptional regulator
MDRLRNFAFLMKDISRLHSKNFERHALGLSMTLAQCKVLAHLERNEGVSQVKLADLTDTDPMTLVRILDRMERDGWVERRAHPGDRRARQLFLTKTAQPVLQEMWRVSDRVRAEAMAGLSAADREQLLDLLSRVQANLNAQLPAATVNEDAGDDDARVLSAARSAESIAMKAAVKARARRAPAAKKSMKPAGPARRNTKASR